LNVSWSIPIGSEFFNIKYGTSSDINDSEFWKNGDSNDWGTPPIAITGLNDNTVYHVWVAAGNELGGWSAVTSDNCKLESCCQCNKISGGSK
jgi:hypothetical protein